jgi:hypothetical protein
MKRGNKMGKVYFTKDFKIPDKKTIDFDERAFVTFCYEFFKQIENKVDFSVEEIEKKGEKYIRHKCFIPYIGERKNTHYNIKDNTIPSPKPRNREKKERQPKKEFKLTRPEELT